MERGVPTSYWESKSTLRVRVNDFPNPSPPERRCISPNLKVTCMATQHLLFLEGWVTQQKLGRNGDSGPTRTMPFLGVNQESRQKQMTGQAEHVCWPLCERRALCGINPCSCGQSPTFGPALAFHSIVLTLIPGQGCRQEFAIGGNMLLAFTSRKGQYGLRSAATAFGHSFPRPH